MGLGPRPEKHLVVKITELNVCSLKWPLQVLDILIFLDEESKPNNFSPVLIFFGMTQMGPCICTGLLSKYI